MTIHESAEDYLEMVLMLKEKKGYVRSIDIATELAVSKPSVSVAMKRLRENGYIIMDEHNFIFLTEKGMEVAKKTYERHRMLKDVLMKIGVSEKTAESDACKIEHDISDETVEYIRRAIASE